MKKKQKKNKFMIFLVIIFILFAAKGIVYDLSYPILYKDYVVKYSKEYNVDPYFLLAVIKTESRFDKNAKSHKGAVGLMQLTESTAEWIAESIGMENFTADDLYNPEINIKMGSWYIDNLRKEFGTTELILAAYNAGRGNVKKWTENSLIAENGEDFHNMPYDETVKYIKKVKFNEKMYRILYRIDG
ncbi:lytic transglycosylase domain-containing protein [Aminipila luticellarii]|uniref:Lytic transglycosylase domain-containing protein n=1 Tax=Aminipila luticellarii TaxID=2507160 RepID=A0A410PVK3_9FIRM|nr:lytic transglycosylase domain-containing protein [Aminipila luticellarii]QAT42938.1 lytic transglycosylase domain-containing protein [Aminipila luticellarii]